MAMQFLNHWLRCCCCCRLRRRGCCCCCFWVDWFSRSSGMGARPHAVWLLAMLGLVFRAVRPCLRMCFFGHAGQQHQYIGKISDFFAIRHSRQWPPARSCSRLCRGTHWIGLAIVNMHEAVPASCNEQKIDNWVLQRLPAGPSPAQMCCAGGKVTTAAGWEPYL